MPIEIFHISPESTHNKQQAGSKSIGTEERGGGGGGGGGVMTATNMCSNFGSKWLSPPLNTYNRAKLPMHQHCFFPSMEKN